MVFTYDGVNLVDNNIDIDRSYFLELLDYLMESNNKNAKEVSEKVGVYINTKGKNKISLQSEGDKLTIFAMIESYSYPSDSSKDLKPDYLIEYENNEEDKEYVWVANHDIRKDFGVFPTVKAYPIEDHESGIENNTKYVFENGYKYPYKVNKRILRKPDSSINIEKITGRRGSLSKHWLGVTDEGKNIRIRERSGRISVYRSPKDVYPNSSEEIVFEAFIGLDFPGLCMSDEEILSIIDSMDYINIPTDVKKIEKLSEDDLINDPIRMLIEDLED